MAPWDGSQNYQYPPGTEGVPDTTIESNKYNAFLADLVNEDLNKARPLHRGGTGATAAAAARANLKAEVASQQVINYSAHVFEAGSFWSSTATGQGAPVDGHAFVGEAMLFDPGNMLLKAYDQGDVMRPWSRSKIDGAWGPWVQGDGFYVLKTGDTMAGNLEIEKANPSLILNKTAAAENASLLGVNVDKSRWTIVLGDSTAEGGGNAGSNFALYRYDDAGAFIDAPFFARRSDGFVGIGTVTPGVVTPAAGSKTLTISGNNAAGALGILELNTDAAGAAGMGAGAFIFTARNGVAAAGKAVAQINGGLAPSGTGGNLGGQLTFYTKQDNAGLAAALNLAANGHATFYGITQVLSGTLYLGSGGYNINQVGDTLSVNGHISTNNINAAGNISTAGSISASGNISGQQITGSLGVFSSDIQSAESSGFAGGTTSPGTADIRAPNGSVGARTAFFGATNTDYYNVLAGGLRGSWSVMADFAWDSGSGWQGLAMRNYHFGLDGTYILFSGSSNETLGWIQGNGDGSLSYVNTSDIGLKEDVRDLRETVDSLDLVRRLSARSFKFKASDKPTIGLIAQEVNEVLGDGNNVVVKGEKITLPGPDGKDVTNYKPWGISYGDLVPYLIDAIGTMAARIEELEARK